MKFPIVYRFRRFRGETIDQAIDNEIEKILKKPEFEFLDLKLEASIDNVNEARIKVTLI